MKRLVAIAATTLLLLSVATSFSILAGRVPEAHASVRSPGLVCVADPSSARGPPLNPCPSSPAMLTGPVTKPPIQTSLSQLTVGVYLWNSDVVNGFDIQLKANSSVLKPAGVSLSNSIIDSPLTQPSTIILECIGGILVRGAGCSTTDGSDVIHLVALSSFGTLVYNPATGLLFTATYNITGTSRAGGIALGFQTGCSSTSVGGGVCVSVADGSTELDSETIQAASFDNSSPPPFVAISASPPQIAPFFQTTASANFGLNVSTPLSFNVGSKANATVVLRSLNGFSGTVSLSASVSPNGLTATLASTSLPLTGTASTNCTLSSNTAGVYRVAISASAGAIQHQFSMMVYVGVNYTLARDYTISALPGILQLNSVASGASKIVIAARNGFTGTLSLSTDASLGISPSLDRTLISGSGTLNLNVTTYELGQFAIVVTASNGTFSRSVLVTVNVFIQPVITVTAQNGWPNFASSGIITFTTQTTSGLTVFLNSTSCFPFLGSPCAVSAQFSASAGGSYSATIFAQYVFTDDITGQNSSLAAPVTFTLNALDFNIALNLGVIEFPSGTSGNATYTVTSKGGFAGQVNLFTSANTGGTALSIAYAPCNKSSCVINITANGFVSGAVTFSSSSPLGTRYLSRTSASYGTTATGLITKLPTLAQTVLINDFTVTGPSRMKVDVNGANPTILNFTSLGGTTNGFRGALTLSSSCLTTDPFGSGGAGGSHLLTMAPPATSLCPFVSSGSSISLTAGMSLSTTVYIWTTNSIAGNYSLTVTATYASGLSRSLNITMIVTDFAFYPDTQFLAITQSSSGSTTLRFASQNGFSDSLFVSASVSPTGPQVSLSSSTIIVLPRGSNSSIMTLSVPAGTPAGTYAVTVTASTFNGPITHSFNVTLQVKTIALQSSIVALIGEQWGYLLPSALALSICYVLATSRPIRPSRSRRHKIWKAFSDTVPTTSNWRFVEFGFVKVDRENTD